MDLLSYDPPTPTLSALDPILYPERVEKLLFHPSQGVAGWLAAVRRWVRAQAR